MSWRLPKGAVSWALYDCANSAFALTVLAGFFGPFFQGYWADGSASALSWQGYTVSIAGLLTMLLAPFLGALGDRGRARKRFLCAFMVTGSLATVGLALVGPGQWQIASLVYVVASVGFYCANIFYDSLLPSVSGRGDRHFVSGLGFSVGYFGSVLLFCLQVLATQKPEIFGLSGTVAAIKLSFLSVALWWALWSIPLFRNVPGGVSQSGKSAGAAIRGSLEELTRLIGEVARYRKEVLWFLLAYWFYIDGAYTLITMATGYGAALGFGQADLMGTLIVVQVVGVPSALLFGWLGQRWGPRFFILIAILIYLCVTLFSSRLSLEPVELFGRQVTQIYLLGFMIGMVQGGLQSLSRSLFTSLVPVEKVGAYFGLYNMVGKGASVLGPLLLAAAVAVTGNARAGPLAVSILFVLGALFLLGTRRLRSGGDHE